MGPPHTARTCLQLTVCLAGSPDARRPIDLTYDMRGRKPGVKPRRCAAERRGRADPTALRGFKPLQGVAAGALACWPGCAARVQALAERRGWRARLRVGHVALLPVRRPEVNAAGPHTHPGCPGYNLEPRVTRSSYPDLPASRLLEREGPLRTCENRLQGSKAHTHQALQSESTAYGDRCPTHSC